MNLRVLVLPVGRIEADCVAQCLRDVGLDASTRQGSLAPAAVLLLDLPGLPVHAGLEAVRREHPLVPVLVMASTLEAALGVAVRTCGRALVISSREPATALAAAVEAALAGWLPAALTAPVGGPADPLGELTPREVEVTHLVGKGRSNVQIAAELEISLHTVRTHLSHVMVKLGAPHRHALAVMAQRRGRDRLPVALGGGQ